MSNELLTLGADVILNPPPFDGTHLSFIADSIRPRIFPANEDFWAHVDDSDLKEGEFDGPPSTPDWIRYANKIMRRLGYDTLYHSPLLWDGSGCSIYGRGHSKENDLYKEFQFLALYAQGYDDESLIVGIRGYPALLQFQSLIRPALMLQTEKRFLNCGTNDSESEIEAMWDGGKNWRDVYRVISYHKET